MQHCGTQRLETERLILRRFARADAAAMYRNWASDAEVAKFLTWQPHASPAVTDFVLADWTEQYANPQYYQWAIVEKAQGDEPIGSIAVVQIRENIAAVQIGYCIGRRWWNRGIMTEALAAVMAFLFDVVGVNRIEARHDVHNPASGQVMRHCGMQYEGTLRSASRNNQGICDICCYAMLRADRAPADETT